MDESGAVIFVQSNGSVLEMNVMNWAWFPSFLPKFLSFFLATSKGERGWVRFL